MRKLIFAAVALSLAIPAFADINLSTGYNSGGTLICSSSATSCTGTDANWSVVENNGFNSGATGPGQAVSPGEADWYGGWVGNASKTPASDWIAYTATDAYGNGLGRSEEHTSE